VARGTRVNANEFLSESIVTLPKTSQKESNSSFGAASIYKTNAIVAVPVEIDFKRELKNAEDQNSTTSHRFDFYSASVSLDLPYSGVSYRLSDHSGGDLPGCRIFPSGHCFFPIQKKGHHD
jgi:hypothetical protein